MSKKGSVICIGKYSTTVFELKSTQIACSLISYGLIRNQFAESNLLCQLIEDFEFHLNPSQNQTYYSPSCIIIFMILVLGFTRISIDGSSLVGLGCNHLVLYHNIDNPTMINYINIETTLEYYESNFMHLTNIMLP